MEQGTDIVDANGCLLGCQFHRRHELGHSRFLGKGIATQDL